MGDASAPLELTHEDIALYASQFGGVKAISLGKKGGQSIITYNSPESAYVVCGSKIVIGQAGQSCSLRVEARGMITTIS